jgi:hypothetical protein
LARGFGFVHHSRTRFCRAVPNPNLTIRNFLIAVAHQSLSGKRARSRRRTKSKSRGPAPACDALDVSAWTETPWRDERGERRCRVRHTCDAVYDTRVMRTRLLEEERRVWEPAQPPSSHRCALHRAPRPSALTHSLRGWGGDMDVRTAVEARTNATVLCRVSPSGRTPKGSAQHKWPTHQKYTRNSVHFCDGGRYTASGRGRGRGAAECRCESAIAGSTDIERVSVRLPHTCVLPVGAGKRRCPDTSRMRCTNCACVRSPCACLPPPSVLRWTLCCRYGLSVDAMQAWVKPPPTRAPAHRA